MSVKFVAPGLHASSAAIMAMGWLGLKTTAIDSWISGQTGGHFQYLTIQGLALAWLTMLASLLCDLLPSSHAFKQIKRGLLMMALPLSVVISCIYWTLIILLPSLILQPNDPKHTEPSSSPDLALFRIPLQLDLALHAVPALTLLADFFFVESKFTKSEVTCGRVAIILFSTWYSLWTEYCASHNGSFPYPFLNVTSKVRVAVYISASLFAMFSFKGINSFHPAGKLNDRS